MSESHVNFLGIPVEGHIQMPDKRKPQKPLSELEPLLRAVLNDPMIMDFGWCQYTPYFNDGDPCIFRVYGFWVRTTQDVVQGEEEDFESGDYDIDSHPTLGTIHYGYSEPAVSVVYEGEHEELFTRCNDLAQAIEGGEFYDVLLDAFGDHAHITVRNRGNIMVEEYSHD
jgi:hypothetical protein